MVVVGLNWTLETSLGYKSAMKYIVLCLYIFAGIRTVGKCYVPVPEDCPY